ncbi:MAG: DUF167 domain-containing protein [Planctomycetaceae bacterium]|nr:DUF167 domain-containing protein [Planctomycetaceae bacterium]
MIDLTPHPEGILLAVRAQAGARTNALRGVHNRMLKVAVTQVAEKGKANQALEETLADSLGLKRSQVELASGATSREKKFLIRGISEEDLRARIEAALAE